MKTRRLLALSTCLLAGPLGAEVTLPALFTDGMVLQQGKPLSIWGWADEREEVTVRFGKSSTTATPKDGRWHATLEAQSPSAEGRVLTVKGSNTIEIKDVLVGEVWLCSGQSNMEWGMNRSMSKAEEIPKADFPHIRLFHVPKTRAGEGAKDVKASWKPCTPENVTNFSAVAYHFGKHLHRELDVPIGLIQAAWGGTEIEPWIPGGPIYNGMVHPLAPYSLRGLTWYQGESNCLKGDTTNYTDKTLQLVEGWRKVFGQADLPFYFVQIAPFHYATAFKKRNKDLTVESLPRFWEAQADCLEKVPNCGMVVVSDITGNVKDIHPGNKRDVGHRLALWALAKDYGKETLVYSGPLHKSVSVEDGKAVLTFHHVGSGLKTLDGEPLGPFEIAGADRSFKPAQATIKGATIVVGSPDVPEPVAVRYAWHETALGNLGNAEGLPAAPFRTDDWP